MPNFITIAAPLNELVKKVVVYKWGKDQEKAYETLKQKLINPPLLALPNLSKTFEIECDASNVGIGVVLLQEGHAIVWRMHFQEGIPSFPFLKLNFLVLIILRNCIQGILISPPFLVSATKRLTKNFTFSINIFSKVRDFPFPKVS